MSNGQPKKGLSPLAWVAIGCAGLVVLVGVGMMVAFGFVFNKAKNFAEDMGDDPIAGMARVVAATNPEIELVSADKEAQVVVFRNTDTGEEFSVDYEKIREGKLEFTGGDGETVTFDAQVDGEADGNSGGGITVTTNEGTATFGANTDTSGTPSWVGIYPGAQVEGTYASETAEQRAGAFSLATNDSLDEVLQFYESWIEDKGMEILSRNRMQSGNSTTVILAAKDPGSERQFSLTLGEEDGQVRGALQYSENR